MSLALTDEERAMMAGSRGPAIAMAARILGETAAKLYRL